MKERRRRNAFPTALILISIMGLSLTGELVFNDLQSVYSVW